MARLGAWAALVLLTLYLVFFGGGWQGIYSTYLRSTSVALAGIVLVVWAVMAWRRPAWRPRSAFLRAIGACLASLAISTATSRFPRLSLEYLAYAVLLAALYLLLVRILADPWFRARMATLATALATVIGVLFVALVVSHWIEWWGLVGRVTVPPLRPESESLTFGNPSAVMTMSVLLTCSAVAAVAVGTRARATASAGLVLLAAVTTLLSGSRAGWLGVAAAVFVTVIVWLATTAGRSQARAIFGAMVSTPAGRIATTAAVLAAAAGTVVLGPAILIRTGAGGEDLRIGYLTAAAEMFTESPFVGTGPGTWVAQRVTYTHPPTTDYYIPHAHNVYLHTLAEQGVVGAIVGAILIVAILTLIRGAARDRTQWPWVLAAVFSTAYFAAHQMFDFYLNFPSVMFAAALPIAWLDATTTAGGPADAATKRETRSAQSAPVWLEAGLAVAVALGFSWTQETPAAAHAAAVSLANEGLWSEALSPAEAAVQQDAEIPAYQVTYGLALARAGRHAEASAAFRRAAGRDGLPESWLNLAAEETLLGHPSDALGALDQALRLGYQRPAVAFAAGELALTLDDQERAVDALAVALGTIPSLAADPWWGGSQNREAIFERVVDEAIRAASPDEAWQIALMAGDRARATDLATVGPASDIAFAQDVIAAWTEPTGTAGDTARDSIFGRCSARPLDTTALGWCARIASRAGEIDEANRYRTWMFTVGRGAVHGAELRVSTTPLVGRTVEGNLALFYGTYTYRRPTPWDLLVPSLPHLTLN